MILCILVLCFLDLFSVNRIKDFVFLDLVLLLVFVILCVWVHQIGNVALLYIFCAIYYGRSLKKSASILHEAHIKIEAMMVCVHCVLFSCTVHLWTACDVALKV